MMNHGKPLLKLRALASTDISGGNAPPFAARAALSFGKFHGMWSDGRPGRSNISPDSLGPSLILYSAASALTCASEKPGPPESARLRNARSSIEWQLAQTSR